MRKASLLGAIALVIIGLFSIGMVQAAENIPNLVGTWENLSAEKPQHSAGKGHKAQYERVLMVVEGQEGRSFFGHSEKITHNKKVEKEKFSGVIYWDNKTLYRVDHEKGLIHATIESPSEIRGVYMEEGKNATIVLLIFKKIK
jgi:hypothetical protein